MHRLRQEDQPQISSQQRFLRPSGVAERRRQGPRIQDGRSERRDDAKDHLQVRPEGLLRAGASGWTEHADVRLLQVGQSSEAPQEPVEDEVQSRLQLRSSLSS